MRKALRDSEVLCDKKTSAKIKEESYMIVVRPAMMYCMETVAVKAKQVERL